MMIIAAMMSMMLMPAQMMAKDNRNNPKPRIENRINNKEPKVKFVNARKIKADNRKYDKKPMMPIAMKPAKPIPKPILKPRPFPKPVPRPYPVYVNDCSVNNMVGTAANVIALAALISAIAD